jgi:hypothetical protein
VNQKNKPETSNEETILAKQAAERVAKRREIDVAIARARLRQVLAPQQGGPSERRDRGGRHQPSARRAEPTVIPPRQAVNVAFTNERRRLLRLAEYDCDGTDEEAFAACDAAKAHWRLVMLIHEMDKEPVA